MVPITAHASGTSNTPTARSSGTATNSRASRAEPTTFSAITARSGGGPPTYRPSALRVLNIQAVAIVTRATKPAAMPSAAAGLRPTGHPRPRLVG
jgi:hypothetical protein